MATAMMGRPRFAVQPRIGIAQRPPIRFTARKACAIPGPMPYRSTRISSRIGTTIASGKAVRTSNTDTMNSIRSREPLLGTGERSSESASDLVSMKVACTSRLEVAQSKRTERAYPRTPY